MRTINSALFDGISEQEYETMLKCFAAREQTYEAGQTICEFDGTHNAVGVLIEGGAALVRLDEDGNRTLLETLSEGDVFGEVLAFSGTEDAFTFIECHRDCRVLFLDYDSITRRCENACHHHSVLVQNLFRLLSTKTLRLSERVEVLSCRSIRDKLLCYFTQQRLHSQSDSFTLPFSLSALAEYISVDRSAMMRELKKLRDEHIVRTESRRVTLL